MRGDYIVGVFQGRLDGSREASPVVNPINLEYIKWRIAAIGILFLNIYWGLITTKGSDTYSR